PSTRPGSWCRGSAQATAPAPPPASSSSTSSRAGAAAASSTQRSRRDRARAPSAKIASPTPTAKVKRCVRYRAANTNRSDRRQAEHQDEGGITGEGQSEIVEPHPQEPALRQPSGHGGERDRSRKRTARGQPGKHGERRYDGDGAQGALGDRPAD